MTFFIIFLRLMSCSTKGFEEGRHRRLEKVRGSCSLVHSTGQSTYTPEVRSRRLRKCRKEEVVRTGPNRLSGRIGVRHHTRTIVVISLQPVPVKVDPFSTQIRSRDPSPCQTSPSLRLPSPFKPRSPHLLGPSRTTTTPVQDPHRLV